MGSETGKAQHLKIANFPFYQSDFPLEAIPRRCECFPPAGDWLLSLERKIKANFLHSRIVTLAHLSFQVHKP